jgi:hypothetical protein
MAGRVKREETIIASFTVDKFVCEYDGNQWMVNSEDNAKQFYYSSLESMCNALLNKVTASRVKDDIKSIQNTIREAKLEILDALRFIDIKENEETEA